MEIRVQNRGEIGTEKAGSTVGVNKAGCVVVSFFFSNQNSAMGQEKFHVDYEL